MKKTVKNLIVTIMVAGLIMAPLNRLVLAEEDEQLKQATKSCEKAARIASAYGKLVDLNKTDWGKLIKDSGLFDNTWNSLKDIFKTDLDIDLGVGDFDLGSIDLSKLDELRNKISQALQDKFGKEVQGKVKDITDAALKSLANLANIGDFSKLDELLNKEALTSVPTINKPQIEETRRQTGAIVGEQKRGVIIQSTKEKCDDLLKTTTESIKRTILYQLSTQIVDWIQNGKKPQFINQPGRFLQDTGRLALDRFISQAAPQLCEPFRLSLQVQVPSTDPTANPFYEQVTCTLDQAVGNVRNFYQDFRSGGWVGYNEIWKPQNNPFGAALMFNDQIIFQTAKAAKEAKENQDRGYTGQTACTLWVKYKWTNDSNKKGSGIVAVGNDRFERTNEIKSGAEFGEKPGDGFRPDPNPALQPLQIGQRYFYEQVGGGVFIDGDYFWACAATKITNPASVTASLEERAAQTDIDFLSATTDIEAFLQTIEHAIINKLTKSGVKGLQGLLQKIDIKELNPR